MDVGGKFRLSRGTDNPVFIARCYFGCLHLECLTLDHLVVSGCFPVLLSKKCHPMRSSSPLIMLLWVALVVTLGGAEVQGEDRPNILFIFSDDHAPHAIGAYDGWLKSVDPTPNIDTLASQGMVFRNSFCTNSICGPSRAVIQTGKHSHKNGFMNNVKRTRESAST